MRTDITEFFFFYPTSRVLPSSNRRAREEEILVGRIAFEEERISGIYVPLDRQGEFSKWWNKRLVGCCNRRVFIYWARESCTRRNLHGKVWIFHTHLTWFTSECRLIPPPYSSRAAGAQDPHERSAKEEETCLNVLRPFCDNNIIRDGTEDSMELNRPKSFIREKNPLRILSKRSVFSNSFSNIG